MDRTFTHVAKRCRQEGRRANGDPWGCRLTRKSGGIDGLEEIIGGVGAGSVFEADEVVDEVGVDAGVRSGLFFTVVWEYIRLSVYR